MDATTSKTYRRGRLSLALDKSQVFPDNPGEGTPAMVLYSDLKGKEVARATYWAACGEGSLVCDDSSEKTLTMSQVEWLESLDAELTDFLYK